LISLRDSNFIGIGPGGFELICSTSYAINTRDVCAAHNWLLELGANFGIVILVAQLYIYIKMFRLMVVAINEVQSSRLYFIGLSLITAYPGAVLSGVSISSIIGFSLVWCYFGILLAYVNIIKTKSY
jgi:teichuronic acid biosynthesis protein TuaE